MLCLASSTIASFNFLCFTCTPREKHRLSAGKPNMTFKEQLQIAADAGHRSKPAYDKWCDEQRLVAQQNRIAEERTFSLLDHRTVSPVLSQNFDTTIFWPPAIASFLPFAASGSMPVDIILCCLKADAFSVSPGFTSLYSIMNKKSERRRFRLELHRPQAPA